MVRARDDSEEYQHDLRPVSELRARAAELLRGAGRTGRPVILTEDGAPAGVLLDVASYSRLREAELIAQLLALGRRDARRLKAPRPRPRRVASKR